MNLPLNRYWRLLATYLRPQWPRAVLLGVLLVGGIGLQLLNPQIVRYFIDTVQAGRAGGQLVLAAVLFMVVALLHRVVAVFATYTGENVGWTATNALRRDLARHCLRLDMAFHKKRTPGEIIERIDGDVTTLGNFFSQLVIKVLGNAMFLLGILVLLFLEDWRVGLGLTVYAFATLFILGRIQKLAVSRWAAYRQAEA